MYSSLIDLVLFYALIIGVGVVSIIAILYASNGGFKKWW